MKYKKISCRKETVRLLHGSILAKYYWETIFCEHYTPCFKKTSTYIIGYKLRNNCPILIIFDIKIPHII